MRYTLVYIWSLVGGILYDPPSFFQKNQDEKAGNNFTAFYIVADYLFA